MPAYLGRAKIVTETLNNEKIGDYEVTRVKSVQTNPDNKGADGIKPGSSDLRKKWLQFLTDHILEHGFDDPAGNVSAAALSKHGPVRLETVAWIQNDVVNQHIVAAKAVCVYKKGATPDRDWLLNYVGLIETDKHGQPRSVLKTWGGLNDRWASDAVRDLNITYVANLDKENDLEIVLTDTRYAGEFQIVLKRDSKGNYIERTLHSDTWD